MRFYSSLLLMSHWDWIKHQEQSDYYYDLINANGFISIVSDNGLYCTDNGIDFVYSDIISGNAIAYNSNDSKFAIVGGNGRVSIGDISLVRLPHNTSKTIFSYFDTTSLGAYYFHSVAFGGGHFVAVGNEGRVAIYDYQSNSWTSKTILSKNYSTYSLLKVQFKDNKFYAVAQNGTLFSSSDFGQTWSIFKSDLFGSVSSSYQVEGFNICNDKFIFTGVGTVDGNVGTGLIAISDDLETFTYKTISNYYFEGASYKNGTYYFYGNDIFVSTDLLAFMPTFAPTGRYITPVEYINHKLICATGGNAVGNNFIVTRNL